MTPVDIVITCLVIAIGTAIIGEEADAARKAPPLDIENEDGMWLSRKTK